MRILLIYDITDDRRRAKIAETCLDYGLDRVQYSAFVGQLSRTHQEELMLKIEHILDQSHGKIHLYPIDQKAWMRRLIVETVTEEDYSERDALTAD